METFWLLWKRGITEEEIDRSVTRLMMTRMKLGMFDKEENVPYTKIPTRSMTAGSTGVFQRCRHKIHYPA